MHDDLAPIDETAGPDGSKPGRLRRRHLLFGAVTAGAALAAGMVVVPAAAVAETPAAPTGLPAIPFDQPTPLVSYGGGFATAATDAVGDLLLLTQADGAARWTATILGSGGGGYVAAAIASDGDGDLAVTGTDADNSVSIFTGPVGSLSGSLLGDDVTTSAPASVAYSATGHNWVVTDTFESGALEYFYGSGGTFNQQNIPTGSLSYASSLIETTDKGVVVIGARTDGVLDAYYQQYFASTWTHTDSLIGDFTDPSIMWSGTDVEVGANMVGPSADDQALWAVVYNDVGTYQSSAGVGESVTNGTLGGTAIGWTGSDRVIASDDNAAIKFFSGNGGGWNSAQTVAKSKNNGLTYGNDYLGIAIGNSTVGISDTASSRSGQDEYWWTQPIDGTGWVRQLVAK